MQNCAELRALVETVIKHLHPALDAKVGQELKELRKLIENKLVIMVTGPMDGWVVYDSGEVQSVTLLEATARRLAENTPPLGIQPAELFDYNGRVYGPVMVIRPTAEDSRRQMGLDKARDLERRKQEVISKAQSLGLTVEELEILRRV